MKIEINVADDEVGNISDGYHTFNELYEHRHFLFCALLNNHPSSFKTKKSKDGKSDYPGWFIAGVNYSHGQITYHLPERCWPYLPNVKEIECNNDFDGHTSKDVIDRLKHDCLSWG